MAEIEAPPKRRILFVCVRMPYPARDGGSIAMWNMISGFYHAGWEVTVMAMNTVKHFVVLKNLPEEIRRMAEFHSVEVDTEPRLPEMLGNLLFSIKSYHVQRFHQAAFEHALTDLLKREKFDIIQCETLYMSAYVPAMRKYSQAKISLRAHNIEHEIWERRMKNETNPVKELYLDVTTRRIKKYEEGVYGSALYDVLVPITSRDATRIEKMGWKGKSSVCPSGFHFGEKDTEGAAERPSIFYLGALDWEPNREGVRWFLKEVWPGLQKAYPAVKFYLAGRSMPADLLKWKAPGVVVVGEVDDAQEFMASKDILISPIFSGSGMRVKLVEAMAAGKPIVATPIAVEGLGVTHGEHLFLAEEPRIFAQSIATLIERPELADHLGKQAQAYCRAKFDNLSLVKKLAEFYDTLLEPAQ